MPYGLGATGRNIWNVTLDRGLESEALAGSELVCRKTVVKRILLTPWRIATERKQIPQVVENKQTRSNGMEPLEIVGVRPRQVRYQVALRPDFLTH